jgi:hypothetical protein
VASNVPAKAGPPVLRWFFRHAAAPLSPEGVVATVVVEPLAELTRESILSARGEILHSEGTKNHHVYHYRAPTPTIEERLDPYLRGQKEFTIPGHRYRLRTVYGLPEFDTLGFGTVLAAQMLRSYSVGGTIGIWNPGQGHLCRIAALTGGPTSFLLSSRDRLELEIAMANVQSGDEAVEVRTEHEASPALLADRVEPASLDALLYVVRPVSGVPWYTQAVPLATAALRPGARWFVVGRSTDLAGTAKQPHPFALEASKKLRGYRVLVLRR